MKRYAVVFLLVSILSSCVKQESRSNYDIILIDYANSIKKELSEIPDSLLGEKKYVLLDNNNTDCFTSMITKVIVKNNRIYILDPKLLKIVVFDKNGNGIGQVGERGQGANEYLNISDFCLSDNGDIYFIDGVLDKLFVFDKELHFKDSKKLPFEAEILHILDNGNILWGLCSWNEKECRGMKVALTDQNLNVINDEIEYDEYVDHSYQISFNKFIETDNHLIYNQPIDNHVYLFDREGKLEQIMMVDFGDANVPDKEKKNVEKHLKEFEQYCMLKSFVVVTDRIVAGQLRKYGKTVPFIYDRKGNISYEGIPSELPTYTTGTGYNDSNWITYMESTDKKKPYLPDSVNNHLNNEGMVLCFQTMK